MKKIDKPTSVAENTLPEFRCGRKGCGEPMSAPIHFWTWGHPWQPPKKTK